MLLANACIKAVVKQLPSTSEQSKLANNLVSNCIADMQRLCYLAFAVDTLADCALLDTTLHMHDDIRPLHAVPELQRCLFGCCASVKLDD